MINYLSDEFMLGILAKIQPFQAEIIKTGKSVHLDAHYHSHDWCAEQDHTIDIDFYVFEGNCLSKTFEFSAGETEEQTEAVVTSLVAYVHSL